MKATKKSFKEKKAFETYLMQKHSADYTVQQHISNVRYFDCWLIEKALGNIIRVTTAIIFAYAEFLREKEITSGTRNNRLNSLRKYYACLIELGHIVRNPASNIFIGGEIKKVVPDPLSSDTLHELYKKFECSLDAKPVSKRRSVKQNEFTHLRFKILASLMIYQGLDTGEMEKLHKSDFNFSNQTIRVSSKPRRRERTLEMVTAQITPINKYLELLPSTQEKMFDMHVQNISHLLNYLKGIEPRIRNAGHIRKSRILIWTDTLKIREAQAKAGHKFVTSTGGYADQNTSKLVDEFNRFHLFK